VDFYNDQQNKSSPCHSSGGQNWKCLNHMNRFGKVMHRFRGYQVRNGKKAIAQGLRANPLVYIGNADSGISGAVQNFWQNFPKSLEVRGNCLKIRLFPKHSGDFHELQGGEQKTHTIYLDFGGDPTALNWVQKPLVPMAETEWYSKSKTFPYLPSNPKYSHKKYEALIEKTVKGDNTFVGRREIIDEYGWRNFGEVYADHEAVGHNGSTPLISHYNNQYDLIYSFICQYVSKSDISWFELMDDLAHHVIDIDIYHTNRDREEYNSGMFWHTEHYLDTGTSTHRSFSKVHLKFKNPRSCGGGPGLEHLYTTGLLYHYYLTGNSSSKDAVLLLSEWAMHIIDGPNTLLGMIYNFKDKLAEKVRNERYPFTRFSGNAITTLLDRYNLTNDLEYLRKVETIIKKSVHPKDDIQNRDLLNAELNWSYTVFL
ncbi:MAG: hypothetical protein ACE5H1_05880, partial [Thermodesulfobacteriota bacterium]